MDRYIGDIHIYVYRYVDNLPVTDDGVYILGNEYAKQKAAKPPRLASWKTERYLKTGNCRVVAV